jgi:hypothetical protein
MTERLSSPKKVVDLGPVFEKIAMKPLPGSSTIMVLLHHAVCLENSMSAVIGEDERRSLRDSTLSRMEANHFVPRNVIEQLWSHYRRLIAKQPGKEPRAEFELPSPPRTLQDAGEFWRIVDATVASFSNEQRREDIVAAATLLVQRIGPTSGNLYFGKRPEIAPKIVNALLWMGLDPSCLDLEVRTTSQTSGSDVHITRIASEVVRQKVEVKHVPLSWEKRYPRGELLLLRINDKLPEQSDGALNRMVGRIRGINYAALWVLFANEMNKTAVWSA